MILRILNFLVMKPNIAVIDNHGLKHFTCISKFHESQWRKMQNWPL